MQRLLCYVILGDDVAVHDSYCFYCYYLFFFCCCQSSGKGLMLWPAMWRRLLCSASQSSLAVRFLLFRLLCSANQSTNRTNRSLRGRSREYEGFELAPLIFHSAQCRSCSKSIQHHQSKSHNSHNLRSFGNYQTYNTKKYPIPTQEKIYGIIWEFFTK